MAGGRLQSLGDGRFDLLVVGGGIVGAGVARDAASRGLKVLLVEQSDFASGTSSRSSRLLHGGLRYLAQGRIGLVREASVEKMRLSRLAPHLSQSLAFVFPVWEGALVSRWKLALGVRIYDLLCGGRNLGKSRSYKRDALLDKVPGLNADRLRGGVRYFDALTNDARLVIDTLRSAVAEGATLLNYTAYVSGEPADGGWRGVLKDHLDGTAEVRVKAVVNATGAWAAGLPHSGVRLRLTKGVHLVVDHTRLPVADAVVLPEGKRILFVIPWGERVILGTTDTDYAGDPADVRTDAADAEYVLGIVNAAFPAAKLVAADVISTWAGVRPLIAPPRAKAGDPSDTSRNHTIRMPEPGWFDVAGGKLTTYRLMAEQTVDKVGKVPEGAAAAVEDRGGAAGPAIVQRRAAAGGRPGRGGRVLPGRVGRPPRRRHVAPHVVALLPRQPRRGCGADRRLDGRGTRLGRNPPVRGTAALPR